MLYLEDALRNGSSILQEDYKERRTIMKHQGARSTLFVLAALVALFDIVYGVGVLVGWITLPPEPLRNTPFVDYTIPMLVLAIVVGGSSLLAAATAFIERESSVLLAGAAGLIVVAYEVVEAVMIQQVSWLEWVFAGVGLAIFGLASYLWTTEYYSHHFPTSHVTHA
jgi:hypothetical protein